ncbi:MAG: hypothetical protein IJ804_07265 [Prevotella sp.]|nr:hypothetical protein [Prevotella sp.]
MKKILQVSAVAALAVLLIACGGKSPDDMRSFSTLMGMIEDGRQKQLAGDVESAEEAFDAAEAFSTEHQHDKVPLTVEDPIPFVADEGMEIGEWDFQTQEMMFSATLKANQDIKADDLEKLENSIALVGMCGDEPLVAIQVSLWQPDDEKETDSSSGASIVQGKTVHMNAVFTVSTTKIDHFVLVGPDDERFLNAQDKQQRTM